MKNIPTRKMEKNFIRNKKDCQLNSIRVVCVTLKGPCPNPHTSSHQICYITLASFVMGSEWSRPITLSLPFFSCWAATLCMQRDQSICISIANTLDLLDEVKWFLTSIWLNGTTTWLVNVLHLFDEKIGVSTICYDLFVWDIIRLIPIISNSFRSGFKLLSNVNFSFT